MPIRTLALMCLFTCTAAVAHAAPLLLDEHALAPRLAEQVAGTYDSVRGGWVSRDGTPLESATDLALRLGREPGGVLWRDRARATLDWMWTLQDTIGGGFTDRTHEDSPGDAVLGKRTDINARRFELLVDAWQNDGDDALRRRASRTVNFMERVLSDGRGGFVAAQVGDRDLVPEANGIAIHAWLRWAAATADVRQRAFALRSIDRVFATGADTSYGLIRRDVFGQVTQAPQLIDQVEMGRACLLAAHLASRAADLKSARWLADRMMRRYEDAEKGGFMAQALTDKKGNPRRATREPRANARAALFLAELASVTGEQHYRDAARRTIASFAKDLEKPTPESADWALAARAVTMAELPPRPTWPEAAKRPATKAGGARPKR